MRAQADHGSSTSYRPDLTREERISEHVRAKFGLPEGWIFRECPRTPRPVWTRMLKVFGETNYLILDFEPLRDFHVRAQLMIGPEALSRLRACLSGLETRR